MVVLEAKGIQKRFGGVTALKNGNLKCRAGRITGLLGANGSGKSTISKIITGVYSPDNGEIQYKGRVVRYRNPHEAKQDGLSMVFQNLSLVADLTVWQNIVLGAEEKKGAFLNNAKAKEAALNLVRDLLPGLDIERKASDLNPGELQIVEIAKALYGDPAMLILDEPTAALELAQVKSLFATMRRLKEKGVAMIFTSHRIWEVMEICDDVIVFRNGEDVGTIDFDSEEKDAERIVGLITGETKAHTADRSCRACSDEVVLRAENLNLGKSIRDISFELKKGEVLGIGGLAGQGQNELMLALAGFYKNLKGRMFINGKEVHLTKPKNAIRNSILLVPGDRQQEGLFLKHSLYTNMIYPKLGLRRQPLFTPRKRYRAECADIVKTLSIKAQSIDTPVGTLSGGNQQKVVVGKWLSFDANVLLLADPAKGVDVGAKRDLYDFILKQVKEKQMSVILYASDNEELIENCDRLMIMYEGQVVATLSGEDLNEDKIIATSMRVR